MYFNEESDYSEENINGNVVFRATVLQPFYFEPEKEKTCGNENQRKKQNIFTLQLSINYMLK